MTSNTEQTQDIHKSIATGRKLPAAVIGVDLGTSGVRAIAFNERLALIDEEKRSYAVNLGRGGLVEQDPQEVAKATEECMGSIIHRLKGIVHVVALCFCGTASSLAPFGHQNPETAESDPYVPLGPAWLWTDVRAAREAQEVRERFGPEVYQRTGCPVHASYWPAKLLWWRRHGMNAVLGVSTKGDSSTVSGTEQSHDTKTTYSTVIAGIKDYLLHRLTGEWVTDECIAATTGLYDSLHGCWDQELAARLDLDRARLPMVVPPAERLRLTPRAASTLGASRDTIVVAGAMDGALVHLGLGCLRPGMASCTVGTSGAVRLGAKKRDLDHEARTWSYPLIDGYWVFGGAVNNAGNVLTWLSDLFNRIVFGDERRLNTRVDDSAPSNPNVTPDRLVSLAIKAEPGAGGLIFLPYVYGERSPLWREDLRGALIGLSPTHGPPEIARAVLEGISLGLNAVFRVLVDQIGHPHEVRASGGFIASPAWVQLQADVFGAPIAVTDQDQAAAAGAAMLGWYSVAGKSLEEMSREIRVVKQFTPQTAEHERYRGIFERMSKTRDLIWPRTV